MTVGGLAALFYVGAPLLVFATLRLKTDAAWQHIAPEELPRPVFEYFGATAPALIAAGFEIRAYIKITGMLAGSPAPNHLALWCHPTRGQQAGQFAIGSKMNIEFSTVLADGFTLDTSNQHDTGAFAKRPGKDGFRAATQDIAQLYKAHCYREHQLLKPGVPRFIPLVGEEPVKFLENMTRDLRAQCQMGDMREASPSVFAPTLVGAFTMTWKQLPPWAQIRRIKSNAAWRKLAAEIENATIPVITPPVSNALRANW